MTEDEIADCRWELRYRANYSARYHRRRSAFLRNSDTFITLLSVVTGAAAFGQLVGGNAGPIATACVAVVTILSLAQVVLRLGEHGAAHASWLRRWVKLEAEIEANSSPNAFVLQSWIDERQAIESECIGELRALVIDCEDASARFFKIPDRQHRIKPVQRLLIHFGTLQQEFPKAADK